MVVRWLVVMRGGRKPLLVLVRSRTALMSGALVPTPTEPAVRTTSAPTVVKGAALQAGRPAPLTVST